MLLLELAGRQAVFADELSLCTMQSQSKLFLESPGAPGHLITILLVLTWNELEHNY